MPSSDVYVLCIQYHCGSHRWQVSRDISSRALQLFPTLLFSTHVLPGCADCRKVIILHHFPGFSSPYPQSQWCSAHLLILMDFQSAFFHCLQWPLWTGSNPAAASEHFLPALCRLLLPLQVQIQFLVSWWSSYSWFPSQIFSYTRISLLWNNPPGYHCTQIYHALQSQIGALWLLLVPENPYLPPKVEVYPLSFLLLSQNHILKNVSLFDWLLYQNLLPYLFSPSFSQLPVVFKYFRTGTSFKSTCPRFNFLISAF